VVPLEATNGIFMSFEIASIIPATCLDTSVASYFIFNTHGGGGNSTGVETEEYTSYVMALENECEKLVTPIPINYRTLTFNDMMTDFEQQSVIPGDYISFGFTFAEDSDKEIGWQCEYANNCPVSEVVLYYPGNPGTAIYIF
jgi:hypothetical protein